MKKSIVLLLAVMLMLAAVSSSQAEIQQITGSLPNDGRTVMYTIVLPEKDAESYDFVVLNHGHGGGREEGGGFGRLAEALAEAGYASIRMDFAGCNESPDPFTQNVLSLMESDSNACLKYILDTYPVDQDKLAILGYSMGGRIAMDIVNAQGNPYDALILLAGSVDSGSEMIDRFFGTAEACAALEKEANTEKGYADYTTQYGQQQQLSKEWFSEMRASFPLDSIGFAGPALVITGTEDTTVPPAIAAMAAEKLQKAGCAVTTLTIKDANHGYGFYSDQPDVSKALEDGVVEFLNAAFQAEVKEAA